MKKAGIILFVAIIIIFLPINSSFSQSIDKVTLWSSESNMTYIMARLYGVDKNVVITLGKTLDNDDDVSVCLFLSQQTGIHAQNVMGLKRSGMKWTEAMKSINFKVNKLFEDIKMHELFGVPGRFKHAYNEYKKWNNDPSYEMDLTDDDVRDLVQLRFIVVNWGNATKDVMKERDRGASWTNMILSRAK